MGVRVMGDGGHGRRRLLVTAVMTAVFFFFFLFFFFFVDRGHGRPWSWATAVMGDAGYW